MITQLVNALVIIFLWKFVWKCPKFFKICHSFCTLICKNCDDYAVVAITGTKAEILENFEIISKYKIQRFRKLI